MEREIWLWLVPLVRRLSPAVSSRRFDYGWDAILLVFLWGVVCTRPVCWACSPRNWPPELRAARLPSGSTLSRRLRHPIVRKTLRAILQHLQRGRRRGLRSWIDGKPLCVSRHSQDRDARFGRGAGGLFKGYKLHLIHGENDRIEAFDVQPLNVDERVVARTIVRATRLHGYLLADGHYDDRHLYAVCQRQNIQLLAPRSKKGGLGHRPQEPSRLRSIALLENELNPFGRTLYRERIRIERLFGQFSSASYGLTALPPWVRRRARVERWVTAALLIFMLVRRRRKLSG